ncbi:MAG TPA: ABC transporter substrate-binding protein [Streptosporangiaceae bacterium]
MISAPNRLVTVAVAVLAAAGLAACSSSSSPSTSGSPSAGSSGAPVYGGTLNIVAASGPDHVDTVPAYYTADYELEHAYTRQLLAYPTEDYTNTSDAGWTADVTPVPDLATVVPSAANGGITNGGLTYTFHIKSGVDWNTTPARQVTSADFIREFKAFCNPAPGGFVGNSAYYTSTIAGLNTYCNNELAYFTNTKTHPGTAANIAAFQNSNNISGLSAPDPLTLQITLMKPASDFLYMMAMPFASARPVEYDSYVPNSLQLDQNTISDGPYQISSYIAGKSITLVRNPAWKASTDPLRKAYVNKIVMTIGVTSAQTQLSDMEAGTEDITNDTPLNPASLPGLETSGNPNFKVWPWSSTDPYIVFNLRSPDAGGAAGKLLFRQAVQYGLDKVAVQKAYGGPPVGPIINTIIPPGNVGYQNYNLYPDNNGAGNVAMCKTDLAKAGYPNGVTVLYAYPNDSTNTRGFEAVQASLALCGITLNGKPEPGSSFFVNIGNSPINNKANQWDLAQPAWIPDWFGNNGRTLIQALFAPRCTVNTNNYGCVDLPAVNSLITQAEGATSLSAAATAWHQADMDIMADAAIVPIMDQGFPMFSSARVRNAMFQPNIGEHDITNLWLANG